MGSCCRYWRGMFPVPGIGLALLDSEGPERHTFWRLSTPLTVHDDCRATRSSGTGWGGSSGRGLATGLAKATVAKTSKASFMMVIAVNSWGYSYQRSRPQGLEKGNDHSFISLSGTVHALVGYRIPELNTANGLHNSSKSSISSGLTASSASTRSQ
jgi:hypothetical protein